MKVPNDVLAIESVAQVICESQYQLQFQPAINTIQNKDSVAYHITANILKQKKMDRNQYDKSLKFYLSSVEWSDSLNNVCLKILNR